MQGYWTFKPLQSPLTEGRLKFLTEAFHLSFKKITFADSKFIFLVVCAQGVIFPYVVYLTGRFLTFTFLACYSIKVSLVLDLNCFYIIHFR
jgi:hypothetical protein